MQEDPQLSPAEREFESALAQLRPTGHSIDRDRMMFSAGARLAQRSRNRWQAAASGLAVLALASWFLHPPAPIPSARMAEAPEPAPAEDRTAETEPSATAVASVPPAIWPPIPRAAYLEMRDAVVEEGMGVWSAGYLQFASAEGQEPQPAVRDFTGQEGAGGTGHSYPRALGHLLGGEDPS